MCIAHIWSMLPLITDNNSIMEKKSLIVSHSVALICPMCAIINDLSYYYSILGAYFGSQVPTNFRKPFSQIEYLLYLSAKVCAPKVEMK